MSYYRFLRSPDTMASPRWSEQLAHLRSTPVYLQPSRLEFASVHTIIYMRGNHTKKYAKETGEGTRGAVRQQQLYQVFIYSNLKYGLKIYGNASSTNISKLQVMQNIWSKYVLSFYIRTETNFLHTTLNIMNVEDIPKNCPYFVNIYLIGKYPEIFDQYY